MQDTHNAVCSHFMLVKLVHIYISRVHVFIYLWMFVHFCTFVYMSNLYTLELHMCIHSSGCLWMLLCLCVWIHVFFSFWLICSQLATGNIACYRNVTGCSHPPLVFTFDGAIESWGEMHSPPPLTSKSTRRVCHRLQTPPTHTHTHRV